MNTLPPLYPPFRYGQVEDDLYRGGYPKPRNFRFLTRLRLKSILSLTPEPANADLAAFCAEQKITALHVRVDKPKEHIPLTFQKTAQILAIVIDPNNYPLFVHCLDGAGVTSALIMCLRKLQCWTMSSILYESSRYNKEGTIGSEEGEFVEKFSAEVELPIRLPAWLW
ncbi:protein-tyrosine phosphatase, partial [Fimicolochytrium jonesii]|uniref:protein-tyrosine phosphatase n=1 Tax=Fimicolochytrium jonesii TaxID=1396493 RepID=UPI0022FDD01A